MPLFFPSAGSGKIANSFLLLSFKKEDSSLLFLAIATATLLAGATLGRHAFWDDEAYTALFARNFLHTGTLSAWDGHNLVVFRGGETLDSHLIQNEVSPLQFWLVAASMAVLGETTIAGRLPFLLAGLLALPALYAWSREVSAGTGLPPWLPTWLLALNVPFLLYIGQCRYYALVLLLVPSLYYVFMRMARVRRAWPDVALGAAVALALGLSNYIAAAATVASLAVGAVLPPFRSARRLAFAGLTCAVVAGLLVYVLTRPGVYEAWHARQGSHDFVSHAAILLWREMRDLGPFEFFPLLPVTVLAAAFFAPGLHAMRALASRALAVGVMMLCMVAVTAAASPQDPGTSHFADMRYAVGIIVAGVFPTAASIWIVSQAAGRAAGALLAGVVVFSNVAYAPWWPPRCTLCALIGERLHPFVSGTDALLRAAGPLPAGTLTMVVPDYMTLPLMFYRPDLRFANLLDPSKPLDATARAELPAWVFAASTPPDALLRGIEHWPPAPGLHAGGTHLSRTGIEPHWWLDRTRAELPLHSFSADPVGDAHSGWALYRRDTKP
jgi:hypothetical protein